MKLSSIIAARNRVALPQDFLFTVDASIDQDISIELQSQFNYSGVIDWGDGSSNTVLSGTGVNLNHTFSTVNTFQVKVSGTIPLLKFDNELGVVSVENLGNVGLQASHSMFKLCGNLTSANLGNYTTIIEEQAFYNCTSLTSVTIGNSVTSIGSNAFRVCTTLPSINIPNSVTSIGSSAFLGCSSLTSINIPNSVTIIGDYAFSYCQSLASATIGNSVTSIKLQTFTYCTSLTSVTIGNSVTSIGDAAFRECTSLGSISCLAMTAPTLGSSVFLNVSTATIDVPVGATGYGSTYGGLTVNYVL